MLLLGFSLIFSLIKGEKDIAIMCLTAIIGCINWYFSKSTALDTPKSDNNKS
jgi:hypothetical protein